MISLPSCARRKKAQPSPPPVKPACSSPELIMVLCEEGQLLATAQAATLEKKDLASPEVKPTTATKCGPDTSPTCTEAGTITPDSLSSEAAEFGDDNNTPAASSCTWDDQWDFLSSPQESLKTEYSPVAESTTAEEPQVTHQSAEDRHCHSQQQQQQQQQQQTPISSEQTSTEEEAKAVACPVKKKVQQDEANQRLADRLLKLVVSGLATAISDEAAGIDTLAAPSCAVAPLSSEDDQDSKSASDQAQEDLETARKLAAKAVRLLVACSYPLQDIELVLAHASNYMERVLQGLRTAGRSEMGMIEKVHVLCVLVYLAHIYVEDEHCPTIHWHRRLFVNYCDMRTLNAAVLGLLGNLDHCLRVEDSDLEARLGFIRATNNNPQ